MSLSTSDAAFLFKLLYPKGLDPKALMRDNALMKWAKHETDFTSGKGIEIPVPYVNPQGIGATNADAAAAKKGSRGKSFTVPQRHITEYCEIDGDVVRNTSAGGDTSQFTNVMEREVDGGTESLGQEMNTRMYGLNDGVRSFLSANGAVNTTTGYLANKEEAQLYEPGMSVQFVNPSGGALRDSGDSLLIDAVDPVAGTVTFSTSMTNIAGVAAGDGMVRKSMNAADLDGIAGWCPATVSGSDSFLGVNRSTYRTRLAGVYYDASLLPMRSGLIAADGFARAQVGTKFRSKSPYFINPKNLAQFRMSVEATRVLTSEMPGTYGLSIDTVEIFGYKFVEDPHAPVNEAILVGDGAFTRGSAGNQPQIDDQDGSEFWYDRATGKLVFTIAHDGNTYSRAPYNIMRVKLESVAQ